MSQLSKGKSPDGLIGFDCRRLASSGPRLDDRAREELRGMAEQIVRSFMGEPNRQLSTKRELRWHPKGSFVLKLAGDKAGFWYDHAKKIGGGDVISFLKEQLGCSIGEAIDEALKYLGVVLVEHHGAPEIAAGTAGRAQAPRGRRG